MGCFTLGSQCPPWLHSWPPPPAAAFPKLSSSSSPLHCPSQKGLRVSGALSLLKLARRSPRAPRAVPPSPMPARRPGSAAHPVQVEALAARRLLGARPQPHGRPLPPLRGLVTWGQATPSRMSQLLATGRLPGCQGRERLGLPAVSRAASWAARASRASPRPGCSDEQR